MPMIPVRDLPKMCLKYIDGTLKLIVGGKMSAI